MRISDWSSDVCSSDLHHLPAVPSRQGCGSAWPYLRSADYGRAAVRVQPGGRGFSAGRRRPAVCANRRLPEWLPKRSEEHTSELQSLMRISYAVLCLKKKKTQIQIKNKYKTTHSSN